MNQKYEEIQPYLNSYLLQALDRVWYKGDKLTEKEETQLRDIHESISFGQENFNAWLKQTLRQVVAKAATEAAH